ncbi:M20 family metallopeptidase [Desulfococcus sp.]|uniref:M20 family metallopeptidase n=1 Tax=Desulfococcus sp. TaxID=2025834 RepID=UPI003593FC58
MREIVELTKALIRFKTRASEPEELQRCAQFIASTLDDCGAVYHRQDANGIPSIWALPQAGRTKILLMSHFDVVDGPDEMFEPVETDGKLFGRGAVDDKYAVALSLVLFRNHLTALKKRGIGQSAMPVGILMTGDEETGGCNGAAKAIARIRADFCIALDGGDTGRIITREKGILRIKVTASGKSAHGSRPWLGNNAIEILMDDLARLKPLFDRETLGYEPEGHWHRTLNIGLIAGGSAVNQVPDEAAAHLDIRYTEHDDVPNLIDEMERRIQSPLTVLTREPIFSTGRTPYLDLLQQSAPHARLGREDGASDARFLAAHGIPGVVWGADGDHTQHAADEHVDIDSIGRLYAALDRFIAAC